MCFQNYFYPDTPKNYQITQYDRPIAEHGEITLPSGKRVKFFFARSHLFRSCGPAWRYAFF
ncbi:unnamed protein product [Laminaria digitata]